MLESDKSKKVILQSPACTSYKPLAFCALDIETATAATRGILHQQARYLLVVEGEACLRLQQQDYRLRPGSLVAILPWEYSELVEVTAPLTYYVMIYRYTILDQALRTHLNLMGEEESLLKLMEKQHVVHLEKDGFAKALGIFRELRSEVGLRGSEYEERLRPLWSSALSLNLFVELSILFCRQVQGSQELRTAVPERIELFQYLYQHLHEKPSLKQLSGVFYCSEATLSQYIQEVSGYGFHELISEMRLTKTISLLLYSYKTLEEVAHCLGYADASHVAKIFNERIGCSSLRYRERYGAPKREERLRNHPLSAQVISYIVTNYERDLPIEEVGQAFALGNHEVNLLLRYRVERSYNDFLHFLRINQASTLLLETDKTIAEIAYEVGYHNTKTFARNFVRYRKMCPRSFRKQLILQEEPLKDN